MSAKVTEYVYSTVMLIAFAIAMGGTIATVQGEAFSSVNSTIAAARIGSTN